MSDPFDRIRLAMGKVVSRINAPLIAGAVMGRVKNPIHDRISHVDVRRCHVDFRAQRSAAVRELLPPACAQINRDSLPLIDRDKGCSCPAR